MVRTEDDSWDITESVGATALGVAWSRAQEATSECPLFTDPYAQMFVDAAVERGWQLPPAYVVERIRSIGGYAASRTKFFDEFFIAAGANGIEQAVILAAGLDARAWRLPWVNRSVVYEIDQPKVLAFKADTLRAKNAEPATKYVRVPVDLRQDWPAALRDAGFDPSEPVAWAAEGLLPYLPAEGQDLLFERIHGLSAGGSRIAVESFGAGFFDEEYLASRREQLRQLREENGAGDDKDAFDVEHLWYIEDRTDVAEWLGDRGWEVTSVEAMDLMNRYGRCGSEDAENVAPRTVFVEAHRVCYSALS
ncbi:SAM-dependent methyltransferase [Mycobacterium deserti]|uniref:S-adenosyl-L-methionine-dependent methyltransferase n=1 Tax=Mycobacterium deserti TaxID=2978347 RepID=A0ABT2M8N3_9MYCO|nr:SAM-dependent methyltransferase [Mycobacterium deserti]MCT7658622.1 SAM-dependent methyltransferase [Mycobacterium deserti]